MRLNRETYEKLIEEDINWLMTCERSLERKHIHEVLQVSADREYSEKRMLITVITDHHEESISLVINGYPIARTSYNDTGRAGIALIEDAAKALSLLFSAEIQRLEM